MSRDIIALIDEATRDVATSPDAMRWTPHWDEPVVQDAISRRDKLAAQGWDGYAIAGSEMLAIRLVARQAGSTAATMFFEALGAAGLALRQAVEELGVAYHRRMTAPHRR